MATARRIAKNTMLLFASNFVQKVLSLFIIIIVARQIGVEDFGIYSFVFSFVLLFNFLGDFGVITYLSREVAKDKSKASVFFGDALGIRLLLSIVVFAFVFVSVLALHFLQPEKYSVEIIFFVMLAALSMVLELLSGVFRSAFFTFERMGLDLAANVINKGVLFVACILIVISGFGLRELVFATLLSSAVNFFASYWICGKKIVWLKLRINLERYKKIILVSVPFLLIIFFNSIYSNIEVFLLSFIKGNTEVAFYSAAFRLIAALGFIHVAITTSLFPVMAVFFSQRNDSLSIIIEKSVKYLAMLILPIAVGTTLLAHRIIAIIYPTTAGNDFGMAAIALQILVWSSVFSFLNNILSNALSSTGFEKRAALLWAGALAVKIIVCVLLIPFMGFAGAAFSMVFAELFLLLSGFSAISKRLQKISFVGFFSRPFFAAALMGAFVFFLQGISIFPLVCISALFYALMLFLLRAFDETDFAIFSRILKSGE